MLQTVFVKIAGQIEKPGECVLRASSTHLLCATEYSSTEGIVVIFMFLFLFVCSLQGSFCGCSCSLMLHAVCIPKSGGEEGRSLFYYMADPYCSIVLCLACLCQTVCCLFGSLFGLQRQRNCKKLHICNIRKNKLR